MSDNNLEDFYRRYAQDQLSEQTENSRQSNDPRPEVRPQQPTPPPPRPQQPTPPPIRQPQPPRPQQPTPQPPRPQQPINQQPQPPRPQQPINQQSQPTRPQQPINQQPQPPRPQQPTPQPINQQQQPTSQQPPNVFTSSESPTNTTRRRSPFDWFGNRGRRERQRPQRTPRPPRTSIPPGTRRPPVARRHSIDWGRLASLPWVDIICCTITACALLVIIFNFDTIIEALFNMLLPILTDVVTLLVIAVGLVLGFLALRSFFWRNRRNRW